jgi:hypothetical protein
LCVVPEIMAAKSLVFQFAASKIECAQKLVQGTPVLWFGIKLLLRISCLPW